MRSKLEANRSPVDPDDYRQFAVDSVRRCLAMPDHLRRSRMVHLMLAKAWHKLADQAEELRKHPRPRQRRKGSPPPAARTSFAAVQQNRVH